MTGTTSQSDRLLAWMSSLADATRVRLLCLLEADELGVAEICDVLQMPQSTVSRHLKVLAEHDWVISHRRGTTNRYRMVLDELDPAARDLWVLTRRQTADWPTARQDTLRLKQTLAARRARQSDSRAFFASLVEEWEQTREACYGSAYLRRMLAGLLPRQWRVVELGCGNGQLLAELAPHVAGVIGVDNSGEMIAAARDRTAEFRNVRLYESDVSQTPLDDAGADAVFAALVLSYVPEPAAVLSEAARITRPGGRLVLCDLLRHDRDDFRRQMGQFSLGFDPDELPADLAAAGFEDVRIHAYPPEPQATGPALALATAVRSSKPSA